MGPPSGLLLAVLFVDRLLLAYADFAPNGEGYKYTITFIDVAAKQLDSMPCVFT